MTWDQENNIPRNCAMMDEEDGVLMDKKPFSQYVNGHECDDVVYYHQSVFLSAWAELDNHTRLWAAVNTEIFDEALVNG